MNEFVVFLILAGIALAFKWLGSVRQSETPPENRPAAPNDTARSTPTIRPPAESEEERVRRFLEALGAPPGSAPPPPVRSRPAPPRPVVSTRPQTPPNVKRSWAQPLPPLVTMPEVQKAPIFPPPASAPLVTPPPLVPVAPPPARRIIPLVRPAAFPPAPRRVAVSLGELLRSADSARQAIVLREVLGPPRGLQPVESENF
ncbi:MAG: hypothetical protein ABI233_12650 [Chthoniobacterales bacterium]